MAVQVYRLLRNRGFSVREDSSVELRHEYAVIGTDEIGATTAIDAASGLAIPQKGEIYPPAPSLKVVDVDVTWENTNPEHGDIWIVTVVYFAGGNEFETTVEPTEWQWNQGVISVDTDCDKDRKPYVNSAGDPFEGTFPDDEVAISLTVWKTEPLYDPTDAFLIANKVNAAAMTILGTWSIEEQQMICRYSRPLNRQSVGNLKARVETHFEIRRGYRPWQPKATDRGFAGHYDNDGNKRGRFYAKGDKQPWSEPVLLNGQGAPLLDNTFDIGVDNGGAVATYFPLTNPTVPDWFTIDPSSTTSGKLLVFSRKETTTFTGQFMPVM